MRRARRQQLVKQALGFAAFGVVGWTAVRAGPGEARELWAPCAWFPQTAEAASDSWGFATDLGWEAGLVPPFRAAERDRLSVGGEARVQLGERVQIGVAGGWLRDATAVGAPVSGAGDLRLGTLVRAARWEGGPGALALGLGWEGKMPNARDEGELGTDETDLLFGGWAAAARGPLALQLGVGLGILGNPHRFANQDDVPMVRARATWTRGPAWVAPAIEADLATSRNPARVHAGGEIGAGKRAFAVASGRAGLTPAAADWGVTVSLGWRAPLSVPSPGE